MNTLKNVAAALVLFASLAGAACASAQSLTCPVTKLSIPSPSAAVGKSVFKKKTYYFCTSNCKMLFDKHPAKYAGKAH